jgi:Ran GTPase-activating protein (RanGAP) involved in mRNA processing and transport
MNQEQKDRLAWFKQNYRTLDYRNLHDFKIFEAVLNDRAEVDAKARAQRTKRMQAASASPDLNKTVVKTAQTVEKAEDKIKEEETEDEAENDANEQHEIHLPIRSNPKALKQTAQTETETKTC